MTLDSDNNEARDAAKGDGTDGRVAESPSEEPRMESGESREPANAAPKIAYAPFINCGVGCAIIIIASVTGLSGGKMAIAVLPSVVSQY